MIWLLVSGYCINKQAVEGLTKKQSTSSLKQV